MSFASVFNEIEYHNFLEVQREMWGHLAPKKNKKYTGKIVYAVGCFSDGYLNPTILHLELGDLDASPWLYDWVNEFVGDFDNEEGGVYELCGSFKNYKFTGTRKQVYQA